MACSDNVVRAGLTPKFKDVENLLRMLVYDGATADEKLFQPTILNAVSHPHTWLFKPPIDDFAVLKTEIPASVTEYEIFNSKFGSIALIVSGKAEMNRLAVKRGSIIFLPSKIGAKVTLKKISDNFTCYQAMFNDF
jgi:mannose-6-phosphate isomerase